MKALRANVLLFMSHVFDTHPWPFLPVWYISAVSLIWHMSRLKCRALSWPSQSHRREQRVWNAGWDEEDASYLSCSQTTRSPGQRAPSVFRWTSSVLPSMVSAAMSVFPLSLSECLLAISSAGRKHVRNFQNSRTFFLLFNFRLPVWRNKCSLKILLCS